MVVELVGRRGAARLDVDERGDSGIRSGDRDSDWHNDPRRPRTGCMNGCN